MKNLCLAGLVTFAAAQPAAAQGTFVFSPFPANNPIDSAVPFLYENTFASSLRYQQVYHASDFLGHGGPVYLITEVSFLGGPNSQGIDVVLSNVQIYFSTTRASPDLLSSVFADNVGAGTALAYSGELRLSSTAQEYGLRIQFQRPFLYDPALGNLLMDVMNFQTIPPSPFGWQRSMGAAVVLGDTVSSVTALNVNSPTAGFLGTYGLITRFTVEFVPEPSSVGLLLGGSALALARWRGRRCRAQEVTN